MITLSELNPETEARIHGLRNGEVAAKLTEMGLLQGQTVKVLYKAPLGDPLAVQVGEYVLSLRKDEASLVEVEVNFE